MRKISSFTFLTLNGYYKGPNEDISWHKHGDEEGEFSAENLKQRDIILFGRKTYELMAGFWPSPMAAEAYPEVAEGMNRSEKIVFSKSLKKAEWQNTRIIADNIFEEIRKLKSTPGSNMTILGSGSIVTQFSDAALIDEYQIMIDPVAIRAGSSFLENLQKQLDLKLISTRNFKSGAVLLHYTRE